MINASTTVRQELINGELNELEKEAEELANDFKNRHKEMSRRHESLSKDLRKAE